MRSALTWILLILLAAGGFFGSYALSEAFRTDAREAWEAQASKVAQWLSGTVLSWLEESYAPLSGLAILFENSSAVTETEFLGATDSLEARATSFFLDSKAVARFQTDTREWSIEFSNDPLGPLSPETSLDRYPAIRETIEVSADYPDQVKIGPPFPSEDGTLYSPAALSVQDTRGPLVVIGLVNYDAIVKGVFDIHQLDGLQLQIQGRFLEKGGPGPLREVVGKPIADALSTVTTRTVSAGADLSLTWYFTRQFSGGPQESLANLAFMGGTGGTLLLVAFIGLLLRRHRTITKKVEEATIELAESRQRLDLALASSGVGTWDWDVAEDTIYWDKALRRIMGTDPGEGLLDMAGLLKIIHPKDAQRVKSEIGAALAGDGNFFSEYRFSRADGEVRILYVRGLVIRDAEGKPLRMIGTSMDITERKTAEEELKKLSRAVEQSPASVVITDPQGIIEYVNSKFCEVTGYTTAEAIGLNPRILKSGETPPAVYQDLWETVTAGREWRGELRNKKKNGELYWESVSISPLTAADGSVQFYLAVKQDISERKQMEESIREKEARFRGYFENSQVGMAVTSPTQGWLEANQRLEQMFGYRLDELRQMTWAELTHPDDLEADLKQFDRMRAGEIDSYTLDKRFVRKDGEIISTNLAVACMRDDTGDVTHVLASFQDITEQKKLEHDQQKRIKELDEAQSAMLNMMEDLDEEKAKAEEATRAKGDFLANMSHEIRTPMNAVIGMAHLALKTELTPKQQDYLSKIQSAANSLLGIINDILDFSKIEAGKLDMEAVEFDLSETLDNVANMITVKAQEKANLEVLFHLDSRVPHFLVGDPLRLNQILVNFGNNAVKFTEKGEIVLAARVKKMFDDKVTLQFSVRDTGIGMTPEQQAKLFQAFTQADTSTTRKYGGTGLGLTISERLVNLMGGEIRVKSELGQGTSFSFTADFGLGKGKLKKRFVPSPDLRGLKVLVVDDNPTSRDILENMLASFSFDVHLATSGEDGLEQIEKADADKPFELVIMDWKMPGMDGIEASRRIRGHSQLSQIPVVIMVTAFGHEDIMRKAGEIGLEGFLLKPVSPSILFDTVMQAFGEEVAESARTTQTGESDTAIEHIQGAQLLLVEDNEINQQVAKEILEGAGLYVTLANNGQEAVDAVGKFAYDAVLMDVQMPVMDGYTATGKIRKLGSEISKVPIIAMTAHAMSGDEEKSLRAGMNDHITKPIDPDRLFATLGKWIRPRRRPSAAGPLPAAGKPTACGQTPPAPAELPESLAGFDLAAGLKRLGGNRVLYRKLLLDFGRDYTGTANQIHAALAGKDFEQTHSLVHNLKGLAGNLEATDLLSATLAMERLVKTGHEKTPARDELDEAFIQLKLALEHALAGVQVLAPAGASTPAADRGDALASVTPELAKQAADRIKAAADIGDVMQVAVIAKELKSDNDALTPFCDKIIQLAEDFDLDGILNLTNELERL